MKRGVILMIGLGRTERHRILEAGYDRRGEGVIRRWLPDIGLRDATLFGRPGPDHAAELRAVVRARVVRFGRGHRDGEEHVQPRRVTDHARIEDDLPRFRVPGGAGADFVIMRGIAAAGANTKGSGAGAGSRKMAKLAPKSETARNILCITKPPR